jgi:hypothetical protein
MDEFGDCLLSFFKFIGLFLPRIFVIFKEGHDETDQLIDSLR